MALLKAINYDPPVKVNKSVYPNYAMTAIDTTNLRLTFTAPESGNVLVRLRGNLDGGYSTPPKVFLGILEGSTVRMRMATTGSGNWYSSGVCAIAAEVTFVQTGLTPGTDYTWDAAYAVDSANNQFFLSYGGPNNTTANDAAGAFIFEVWEA